MHVLQDYGCAKVGHKIKHAVSRQNADSAHSAEGRVQPVTPAAWRGPDVVRDRLVTLNWKRNMLLLYLIL